MMFSRKDRDWFDSGVYGWMFALFCQVEVQKGS